LTGWPVHARDAGLRTHALEVPGLDEFTEDTADLAITDVDDVPDVRDGELPAEASVRCRDLGSGLAPGLEHLSLADHREVLA
jgi:hypothetical protein